VEEMSRFPYFLDNRLTDACEVVGPMCWLLFTPQDDFWYSFLLRAESTPGVKVRLEGLGTRKSNDLIGN
jgi:hypothetical protein